MRTLATVELVERSDFLDIHCSSNVRLHLPLLVEVNAGNILEISHDTCLEGADIILNGTKFMYDGLPYISHGGLIFYSDNVESIGRNDTVLTKTYIKIKQV